MPPPVAPVASGRPWLAHYEPGVPDELPAHGSAFTALFDAACASAPGLPAVTYLGGRRTYAELGAQVERVAGALARDGVGRGTVVVVALPASPAFVAVAFGALRLGAVCLVAEPSQGAAAAEDLHDLFARYRPGIVVTGAGDAASVARAAGVKAVVVPEWADASRLVATLTRLRGRAAPDPAGQPWEAWLHGARASHPGTEPEGDDPAVIFPGTGPGQGEDLVARHGQLTAGALMLRAWLTDSAPGNDTWLVAARLSSPFGFVGALGTGMLVQAHLGVVRGRDPATLAEAARSWKPAVVLADPELAPPLPAAGHTGPSLTAWDAGCPALDPLLDARCIGYSPPLAAGLVLCNPVNGYRVPSSVGIPLPGAAARVVDERGFPAPSGAVGRLEVKGPNLPQAGRWFPTGAFARQDEAGFVYLDREERAAGIAQARAGAAEGAAVESHRTTAST